MCNVRNDLIVEPFEHKTIKNKTVQQRISAKFHSRIRQTTIV